MRNVLIVLFLLVAGIVVWYIGFHKKNNDVLPKQQPLAVSKYSDSFNIAVNKVLDQYAALTDAFVNWDTAAVNKQAAGMQQTITGVNMDELKKDTAIYQTAISYTDMFKSDLDNMQQQPDITHKREALNSFTQNLYDWLRVVHYDRAKLYLQECPMAFKNETEAGIWLSRTEAIRNPYMGVHHPKYGKAMVECGDTKDTLNFTGSTAP